MPKPLQISVVIPIYNNEHVIEELSQRLISELNSFNFEVIYVNDCSIDKSSQKLQYVSSLYSQINYINLSKNVGQQKATLEGIKKAIGKKTVILDGDLQDDPKLITHLYTKANEIESSVFVKRKGVYQSKKRMITSILIKKVIQLMSGLHYKAGSYYMFDQYILKKVISSASNCKHPYMSIIVAHQSKKIHYVTAKRGKNLGVSGYNFRKRIKAALMAIYCSAYCIYSRSILGLKNIVLQ